MSDQTDNTFDEASAARSAEEEAVDILREQTPISDEQVSRGVESALDQTTLKLAAAELEKDGWRVLSVELGRIVLTGGPKFNWKLHGVIAVFTSGLWLFYAVPASRKPRGHIELTLDALSRPVQRKLP